MHHPKTIMEKMEMDFTSIEQFYDLVLSSHDYFQKNGDLQLLKIFIPKSNQKTNDGYSYLHSWNPEKSLQATNALIHFFTKEIMTDSYCLEEADDGYFIAFTTNVAMYLNLGRYYGSASYYLNKAKENNVKLSLLDWETHFPIEYHRAWHNRSEISHGTFFVHKEHYEQANLIKEALYDGKQNWLAGRKYLKIENWTPKNEFVSVAKKSISYKLMTDEEVAQRRQELLELYPGTYIV